MIKSLIKLFLCILALTIGLSFTLNTLNAIGADRCQGTNFCDAITQACFEEEYLFHYKTASRCHDWWNCRSYFVVFCWDAEEDEPYRRSAHCDTPAGPGECIPPWMQ